MTAPEPPINPYESPQTEATGASWASLNRQQIGLAWLWISLGGITLLLAGCISFGLLLLLIPVTLIALGWIIAGCGTLFRPRTFIPMGLAIDHLAVGLFVCCGFVVLIVEPLMGLAIWPVLLILNFATVWMSAKARVVLNSARQATVPPEQGGHEN